MPNDIQSSGNVSIVGTLGVGDIHAVHGNQLQPAFTYVDHMGGTVIDSMVDANMINNKVMGIAHAPTAFLPHHQRIMSGASITDATTYMALKPEYPCVRWAVTNLGATVPQYMAFGERYWGHEFVEFNAPPGSTSFDVNNIDVLFTSTQLEFGGSGYSWNDQGFTLFFGKQRLGSVANTANQRVVVSWVLGPSLFELELKNGAPPSLFIDSTPFRYTFGSQMTDVSVDGSVPNVDMGQQFHVRVMFIAGRLQINMTGMSFPLVVHLNRLWRSTIAGKPKYQNGNNITNLVYVPKGVATRFPTAGSTIRFWNSGSAPSYYSVNTTTLVNKWIAGTCPSIPADTIDNRFDVLQLGTDINTDRQVGFLYGRITRVDIRVQKTSGFSFSLHGLRFADIGPSYISPPQQLGFTPLVSFPPMYDIHFGDDTVSSLDNFDSYLLPEFGTAYYRAYITDLTLPNSQISQYQITSSYEGSLPFTYLTCFGSGFYRWSYGVERVSVRYPGISELTPPDENAYNLFQINNGENGLAELLLSVEERASFDFGSMRINRTLECTFNNYSGIVDFASNTGIQGSGNIALMWRWGYAHQENDSINGPVWSGLESAPASQQPGFSRMYGFCDTYAFQGRSGSYTMSMSGKSLTARLDDTTFYAPPNFDGWNHYRAVYTILQMAGVPDEKIAFLSEVPSDPYGLQPTDPDYATGGYYLPIGIGSNPWTPITRGMTAGQLLSMIQQVTQFVLYADSLGMWQYLPFLRDATGNPKRIFREYYPYDSNFGLTQMWDVEVVTSTADVRNEVIILGIDAYNPVSYLDPILVARRDLDSINAPSGEQPANYVGWKKNFAMVDSRFATHKFAEQTAEKLFNQMRQPSIQVAFTCWGQPDIYPMDFIAIEYQRSGISGFPAVLTPTSKNTIPLFVTGITTNITRTSRGTLTPTSRITARYIPLEGYGSTGAGVSTRYNKTTTTSVSQTSQTGSSTGSIT